MTEATDKGASAEEKPAEKVGPQPDLTRFNEIEEMAENLEKSRAADIAEQIEEDPGFAAREAEIEAENKAAVDKEGLEFKEEIEEEEEPSLELKEEKVEPIPEELPEDPLADYIVMQDDVPMMKARIDGKDVLIPMDRARAQIQKGEAAEVRLQAAATLTKDLTTRSEALSRNEQALREREARINNPPPVLTPDVDDEALLSEAKDLIGSLYSGTQEEATVKLVSVLKTNRAPVNPAPTVNPQASVAQVARVAKAVFAKEQSDLDSKQGFKKFRDEYPDIIADSNLFLIADSMTDVIVAEHPEWEPPRVMLEAGKRTREWRGDKKSPKPVKDPVDRQTRKARLVPMPRPADAKPAKAVEEQPQTPQEAVAEMREARGQMS